MQQELLAVVLALHHYYVTPVKSLVITDKRTSAWGMCSTRSDLEDQYAQFRALKRNQI